MTECEICGVLFSRVNPSSVCLKCLLLADRVARKLKPKNRKVAALTTDGMINQGMFHD